MTSNPTDDRSHRRDHLIFRADADTSIGSGHVMRCLALAQSHIDRGGCVSFLMAPGAPALEKRLTDESAEVVSIRSRPGTMEDARETSRSASDRNARWVVLDGYHFGTGYQRILKEKGLSLLVIDDCGHAGYYYADFVLNQNLYASEDLYPSRERETRLLLGPKYTLLRREFLTWKDWTRQFPEVARNILVSLGGGDRENTTALVLRALQEIHREDLAIRVVVGPSNPHGGRIKEIAEDSVHAVEVLHNVTDMPDLMAWADIAISGGGSSCYEIAFMGLPACIVITADNQVPLAESLACHGIAVNTGWYPSRTSSFLRGQILNLMENQPYRRAMSTLQRQLLDGKGASRVASLMAEKGRETWA